MRKDGLRILLYVIGDSRPAPGDFEITPVPGRHLLGRSFDGLPTPQPIEAGPFPSRRCLTKGLAEVPGGFDAFRQTHGKLVLTEHTRRRRQERKDGREANPQAASSTRRQSGHGHFRMSDHWASTSSLVSRHAFTVPSAPPAAMVCPSDEHATLRTSPPVDRLRRNRNVAVSHTLTWPGLFQSPSPETSARPSGEKASDQTSLSWALLLNCSRRDARSHVLSRP